MDTRQTREEWIKWLLEERHISAGTLIDAQLGIDVAGGELTIPVFDEEGTYMFSKYRRSPWRDSGPKYRYAAGTKAALYGAELLKSLKKGEEIVITEGELDALALRSLGQPAVSTTGGSGTWKEEWSAMLAPFKPIICYDADKAGIEGALKVASTMPHAKIAWLHPDAGKDPTEVLSAKDGAGALGEFIAEARQYPVPGAEDPKRLKKLSELVKVFREERRRMMQEPFGTPFHMDVAIEWAEREIAGEKKALTYKDRQMSGAMATQLDKARTFPIAKIIKVSREGFALCPFHEEDTGSLKVYKDNHSYCYGKCGKKFDAVDIYMKVRGCDYKQALKDLV